MSDTSGSLTSWFYNVLGQVTNETHTIESTNYSVTTDFDAFGRPLHQTIPSQGSTETLNYTYNEMGALSGLNNGTTAYVSQIHYNPSGQVTEQTLGNGLRQQFCYEASTLRLRNLRVYSGDVETCVETPTNPLLSFAYFYEDNGNVRQIIDATRAETLNYTYDALDRLDTVSGAYSQDYDYNEIGNITNKTTTTSTSYSYGDPAHKHAVTSLSTGGSYTYDQNGNMITRVEGGLTYMQAFDAENRLISVTVNSQTTQFVYDGDGNLVKKIKPDGSKTLYVGEIYEVDMTGGTVTGTRTYYPAAGAMRVGTTLYYVLKDHLGSASVVTNTNGTIVTGADIRYYPFGEARSSTSSMLTDKLYTGQREMAELGIYHYKARFYSPYINRFLQPDTIVPGYANPQSLNRYSYVTNNPLKYTDPTGHMQCENYQGSCVSENQLTNIHKEKPKKIKEDVKKRKDKDEGNASDPWDAAWASWTTDSYPWSFPVAGSWGDQGPMEIDPMEFEQMLKAVGDDLQGFPTLGWYDTPFYNAGGDLTGIGCVNGKCYDRSELNYIGEGEALAKMGFSREATQDIVWAWKNKGPFVLGLVGLDSTPKEVSQGAIDMTDIGWNYYAQHYSGAPYPEPMWP